MKYINKHNSLIELNDALLGIDPDTSGCPESVTIEPLVLSQSLTIQGVFTFSGEWSVYEQGDVTIAFQDLPVTGSNANCYIVVNSMYWESYENQTVVVSNIKERNTDVAPYIVPWVSYLPNGNVEEIRYSYSSWTQRARYLGDTFCNGLHIYLWGDGSEVDTFYCTGSRNPMIGDKVLKYYSGSSSFYAFNGGRVCQIIETGNEPRVEYNKDMIVISKNGNNLAIESVSDNFSNSPKSHIQYDNYFTSFGPFFFIPNYGNDVYHVNPPTWHGNYYTLKKINEVWTLVYERELG